MQEVEPRKYLRIYGWAADNNGCGYYRIGLPMLALMQRGHFTYASTVLEPHAELADVIVGQRVCREDASALFHLAKELGKKVVFEIDDDLFNIDPSSQIAHSFFSRPEVQKRVIQNIEIADAVTCTTEPLAEVLRKYSSNVFVVPNYIDAAVLSIREPKYENVTIGWAGSSTHQMDFQEAGRFLKKLAGQVPEVHFAFSGEDYGRKLFPPERYTYHPFVEDIAKHYEYVSRLHIGVAPLKRHRFNASKSHLKALEYGALGVPCVVSDELPYRDYVKHGETGFLAKDWYEGNKYLRELIRDPELRATIAANAFEQAKANTIQANAYRWEEVFRSVLDA